MSVATLGQAIGALEEQLFVGRAHELAVFQRWLTDVPPAAEILVVSGPGGVGKTALLGAFRRHARVERRQIVEVDGQEMPSTVRSLLGVLGGGSLETVVRRLNSAQALVLFDSFDQIVCLGPFLRDRLFPRLDEGVRIVIASRQSLTSLWPRDDVWHKLLHALPLDGLSGTESSAYLERRGLADRPVLMEQIRVATGGHPLGLSLAADLAERLHLASLETAPEWHLVVRSLVERLRETEDSDVRELLECAAVVHDFDEATLLALAGRVVDPVAFARICGLSVVRPTPHGLTLHEDVRHLLVEDLRWRDAVRYDALRERAVTYYRDRAHAGGPAERARAVTNRFYLSDQRAVRTALFGGDASTPVSVDPARQTDHAEIGTIWKGPLVAGVLASPRAWLRVARDRQQQIVGLAAVLPLARESLPVVAADTLAEDVIGTFLTSGAETLPDEIETTQFFWHVHMQRPGLGTSAAILPALWRASVEVVAEGGVHLTVGRGADHRAALEALGFQVVHHGPGPAGNAVDEVVGYVLDLRSTGVDFCVDALAAERLAPPLPPLQLQHDVQAVLTHWRDDVWLSRSPVLLGRRARAAAARGDTAQLREQVQVALARIIEDGDADERLAGQALELAYLTPRMSHVAAMERLAVSRATFYRLIRRGVHALAEQVTAPETS